VLPIDLEDVQKTFRGGVHALRGVGLRVHAGEIFGLLGPNGAGKSTLVKIIMTVVRPTRANGTILGRPIGHQPTLQQIGYLPEHHRFPRYLTGRQAIDLFGGLCGVPRAARRQRTDELLETVRMTEWADRPFGTYSKGMQQRIGLAAALVNSPSLVLLDEPTDGVDPVGRREIREVLLGLRERGCAVFLNSHLLSELELVCDRVAIMVQGEVVAQGTIRELTSNSERYEVVIAGAAPAWTSEERITSEVAGDGRTRLILETVEAEAVQPVIDRLRSERRLIASVSLVRDSLEQLFMRSVTDPSTGRSAGPGAVRGPRPPAPTRRTEEAPS
jgi:ABC-2 type transport system ATP-binding protein